MRRKLDITELEIGMFVAELDRPWLETPFLFQGFLIENQEELGKLQEICEHVFIDEEKSGLDGGQARVTTSMNRQPATEVRKEQFREAYRNQRLAHQNVRQGVIKLLDDHRLGRMIEAEPVRTTVSELVESVLENPNAALWLTKLRGTDEYTQAHSLNVAVLATAFAHHLACERGDIAAIGLGAILHDIGLSEIATDILTKKSSLTDEEFDIVRGHPLEALRTIERPEDLPAITRDVIRWHHERIDGSGYPDQLRGDDIPRHALIVGMADCYDAMVSDRAYRRGMLPSDALQEMLRQADATFGRSLVQEFIRSIGIYPPGSIVKLSTGAIAAVVASNEEARLSPLVLMLKTTEGEDLDPPRLVDLSGIEKKIGQRWTISEIVPPADYGIDMEKVAENELRGLY